MTGVLIRRRDEETDTHKERQKREDSHLQAEEVISGETNPANIWIVDL